MNRTAPEQDELTATDDEPYVRLPRPLPRWMQRAIEIETAVHLVVVAIALLMIAAGALVWAVRGIT